MSGSPLRKLAFSPSFIRVSEGDDGRIRGMRQKHNDVNIYFTLGM